MLSPLMLNRCSLKSVYHLLNVALKEWITNDSNKNDYAIRQDLVIYTLRRM